MSGKTCEGCCTSILEKYPDKKSKLDTYLDSLDLVVDIEDNRGFLIGALHTAQDIYGYLPEEVQLYIAEKLRLTLGDVNGVVTFYSFFTTTPPGKHKINVCTGTACFVKGATKVLQKLEDDLGIKDGDTTEDGMFSLSSLRCVGACSLAPVVMVDDKVYGKVTVDKVSKIIKEYN